MSDKYTDIKNKAVNLIPAEIIQNSDLDRFAVSDSFSILYSKVGDYAFKFGIYDTNVRYNTYTLGGAVKVDDALVDTNASMTFSSYGGSINIGGNVGLFSLGYTEGPTGSTDYGSGYVGGQVYVGPVKLSGGADPNNPEKTTGAVALDLKTMTLETQFFGDSGRNVGYQSTVGVKLDEFLAINIAVGRQEASLALSLESQTFFPVNVSDNYILDDMYDSLISNFPDMALSKTEFLYRVEANMLYNPNMANGGSYEAGGIVVYETLFGSSPSDSSFIQGQEDIDLMINSQKQNLEQNNQLDGFSGYVEVIIPDVQEGQISDEEVIEDADLPEVLLESSESVSAEGFIAQYQEETIIIEKQDGTTEVVVLDPVAHDIEIFETQFADAQVDGIVIASFTETITRADGSTVNVTTTEFENSTHNYIVEETVLDQNSTAPTDGFTSVTFIAQRDVVSQDFIGYHRVSEFSKGGIIFESHEYQTSPDGNTHIRQDMLRSDGNGGFIEEEGAVYIVPSDDFLGNLQSIGETAGGLLASHFAEDSVYQQILYSAALKTLGAHFGTVAAFIATGSDVNAFVQTLIGAENELPQGTVEITPQIEDTFFANLHSITSSKLSSVIVGEVGEALGINGTLGGDIFNVTAGNVTTGVISDTIDLVFNNLDTGVYTGLLSNGFDFSTPIYNSGFPPAPVDPNLIGPPNPYAPNTTVGDVIQLQVLNALGGFAGNRLAGEVIEAENEAGALFGAAGSAIGAAIATGELIVSTALKTAFQSLSQTFGAFGGPVGVAIGTFVGQVLGTALGNLFGDNDPPSSWAKVEYNDIDQEFRIEMFGGNSADTATANSMASQMLDAVNNVIALSHGTLRLGATTPTVLIGYKGDKFTVGDWYGDIREFDTAADAVMHGAFKMMKDFDLVGGHAVLMRAWHNSDATNIHEFQEDLEVAEAFQNYLLDPTSILALMMNEPDSDLAQAWAAILQRAAELELHLPSDKDLDGGWGSILLAQGVDPSLIPDIQDDTIILTDPVTGEETVLHHAIGPGYEIVRIEGTDGNDIIEIIVDGPSITYVDAGAGDDVVQGSEEADIIVGGAGDDDLSGLGGNDWIHGGSGADNIDGGSGQDTIVGAEDADIITGGSGQDIVYGNDGDDIIYADGGADFIYGGAGNDTIISTTSSAVKLYGGDGDDTITVTEYNNTIIGGKGNDTVNISNSYYPQHVVLIGRDEGHDVINMPTGRVTIRFDKTISLNELYFESNSSFTKISVLGEDQSVTINGWNAFRNVNFEAHDGLAKIQHIDGTVGDFEDVVYISSTIGTPSGQYNVISDASIKNGTTPFEERPSNSPNYEIVHTWAVLRNDIQAPTSDLDKNNNIVFSSASSVHPNYVLDAGPDFIDGRVATQSVYFYGDSGDDTIYGGNYHDILVGGLDNDDLRGFGGVDELYGSHGSDELHGGSGDDLLYGGAGSDLIFGDAGNDTLEGGDGNDYLYDHHGFNTFYGGDGADLISSNVADGTNFMYGEEGNDTLTGGYAEDNMYGGSGDDILNGRSGDDWLHGGEDNDTLNGGDGRDIISGGLGDDTLDGGDGHDQLIGGEGNDTLNGGLGDDILRGGEGDDTYIYNLGDGLNVITETSGFDTLQMGVGITLDDLSFSKSGDDLQIHIDSGFIVTDFFSGNADKLVEELVFEDLSTFDLTTLLDVESAPVVNGVTAAQNLPDPAGTLNGLDEITIAVQVQALQIGTDKGIFDTETPDGGDDAMVLRYDASGYYGGGTNVIKFALQTTEGQINVESSSNAQTTNVQNIVATWKSGEAVKLYINGVEDTTSYNNGAFGGVIDNVQDLLLGVGPKNSSAGGWAGSIDEFQIYDYALDSNDITDLFSNSEFVLNDAPIASEDSFVGQTGTEISGNLLSDNGFGLDSDANSDILSVEAQLIRSAHGSVEIFANGDFVYTPDIGFVGDDAFSYTVKDANGGFDTGQASVQINNVAPTALDFSTSSFGSYNGSQDSGGSIVVIESGAGVQLDGNAWKKTALDYDITENTILTFEYMSTIEGEVQGISLETDDSQFTGIGYQLYGTETPYTFSRDFQYTDIGNWQQFTINVGAYQAGDDVNLLAFVNDHDGGGSDGTSFYRNITIYESVPAAVDIVPDIDPLMFDIADFSSFSDQDTNPTSTLVNGTSVELNGNNWKSVAFDYEVTDFTVMSFDFKSNNQGEVHGIGLDNDNDHTTDEAIRIYGSQSWGQDGPDYSGTGSFESFEIDLSDYYTVGNVFSALTFVGDDDASSSSNSVFENIQIYELGTQASDVMTGTDQSQVIVGLGGDDTINAGMGDDVLYGGSGVDQLYGEAGADTFVFEMLSAFSSTDSIHDFSVSEGDIIDISDLLLGYDPLTDAITDFVKITDDGSDSILNVDADGGADNFVQVAYIYNETGLTDEDALETSGNLITV